MEISKEKVKAVNDFIESTEVETLGKSDIIEVSERLQEEYSLFIMPEEIILIIEMIGLVNKDYLIEPGTEVDEVHKRLNME